MNMIGIEVFCPSGIGTPGVDNPGIAWQKFPNAVAYFHKWIDENGYRTMEPFEAEYYGPKAFTEPYQIEIWRRVEK